MVLIVKIFRAFSSSDALLNPFQNKNLKISEKIHFILMDWLLVTNNLVTNILVNNNLVTNNLVTNNLVT